jgi:hypothetical protein
LTKRGKPRLVHCNIWYSTAKALWYICDNIVALETLSSTFDPKDLYKSLNVGKIYELAMFYPDGFTQQE